MIEHMFVYSGVVEPARHRLAFAADADAVLARVEARLAQQGAPAIRMRREVVFEADTGDFMLRSRVAQALMDACDHDSWTRLFQPLD
jgi:hypothetical protein